MSQNLGLIPRNLRIIRNIKHLGPAVLKLGQWGHLFYLKIRTAGIQILVKVYECIIQNLDQESRTHRRRQTIDGP